MQSEKVQFTKERETLLFTLYGKALNSRSPEPVLQDPWAEAAVGRIDYDFGKLNVRGYEALLIASRAKQFDLFTTEYLSAHPDATVLHLGCGLDSRVFRVDPPAGVNWFDVDYPDVIELRRRLFPERSGYTMIGSALEELGWLDGTPSDSPALVVAEGVMMYLKEEIIKNLLNAITGHFPGGQLVFDAWNQQALAAAKRRGIKGTGATFGWAIGDPEELSRFEPRLRLVKEFRTKELVAYKHMSWAMRGLVGVMDLFPALRRANRIILYAF
ncbi:MAG: class I SAM-dependent methyltransferase [Chloroflexi bacterium]|nr:MAG: class I SAM-dependent methyltransferase [Chloroflexota bacterium]